MILPTAVSLLMVFGILSTLTEGSCPNIVSRSDWGARNPKENIRKLLVNPPTYAIIHHSATGSCTTKTACTRLVKSIQNHHMDTNRWDDIGYNFVVGEDGNVYEGRGWEKMGAHAPNYNSKSIGICIIGTYASKLPNSDALESVKNIISCGVEEGKINSDYKLLGHRQVRDTECPGSTLYEEIKNWSHWTSQP